MLILAGFVLIFVLRVFGITLSTLQTLMMVQDKRALAMAMGMMSSLVYVVAIGKVVNDLSNIWYLIAYTAGFGAGTWLGMVIDARLALGFADVRVISAEHGPAVAESVRMAGYGATSLSAEGRAGSVTLVETIAPRKSVTAILDAVAKVDAQALVVVADARKVQQGYWRLPAALQK